MDLPTCEAYLADWRLVRWQLPTTPNKEFYQKWHLLIETMTGIRVTDSLCILDQYSVANTVGMMIRSRLNISDSRIPPQAQ